MEKCSIDEEMLMWTSYRYAIGRKTYVSSLASYMAHKYYPILTKQRLEFSAQDIRSCITDVLHCGFADFRYDGSVSYEEREGLPDLLRWINDNVNKDEDLIGINSIWVYKDGYSKDHPKLYRVCRETPARMRSFFDDYHDLLLWNDLASCFDVRNHKMLTFPNGNQERCFESWIQDNEFVKEENGYKYYQPVKFRYKMVYRSVEDFVARGERCGLIYPEDAISIDNVID
ncbi:MAG: hypothetical protein HUJ56_01865 [Erysipelotrichaceae bacterium]|nr:hypothetical protein [Erysipelotrichaceae bacterium]